MYLFGAIFNPLSVKGLTEFQMFSIHELHSTIFMYFWKSVGTLHNIKVTVNLKYYEREATDLVWPKAQSKVCDGFWSESDKAKVIEVFVQVLVLIEFQSVKH